LPIRDTISALATRRRPKLLVMREEKDRFDAMRAIQYETMRFRRWNDLLVSVIVFAIVWTIGAVVFWCLEDDLTYFEGLYFCFCSLLTIGYGDITPKSNAGRPFFVMWSLIAIPTMTMLISKMSDTIVASFKHGTEKVGDWLVLPQSGKYKSFFGHFPCILGFMEKHEEKKRVQRGFQVGADADTDEDEEAEVGNRPTSTQERQGNNQSNGRTRSKQDPNHPHRTIEELAKAKPSSFDLAQQLAFAIRRTTKDAIDGERKRYNYEEWVEFTRLIQFTDPRIRPPSSTSAESRQIPGADGGPIEEEEDEFGVFNWDWIGENSPMLAKQTEPEWVLDRLCESLVRYVSTQETRRAARHGKDANEAEEPTLKKESDLGLIEEDT
jgi:potassium channel subfamily K